MTIIQTINQYQDSISSFCKQRKINLGGGDMSFSQIDRLDNRLLAHIDGLRVAGETGWKLCLSQLENPGPGELFAATVLAIESKDPQRIAHVFSLAEALPEAQSGLFSAFGWVSSQFLQGTIKELLSSTAPFHRQIGITCCALHRVDPGAALTAAIRDESASLRNRALKAAGEMGRIGLLPLCEELLVSSDNNTCFWAAWSAALLGSRNALLKLSEFGFTPNKYQARALNLLLKILPTAQAHAYLQSIAPNPANYRALIQGAGNIGDPFYVPWLIKQMSDLKTARLAGEAFSFITSLDLAYLDLEVKPPKHFETGPNDDPEDENVDLDPDDNLPWPDAEKIANWWQQHGSQFRRGTRYFMGKPVTREHCIHVLKEGFQRQRIAAAQYLCILAPGTVLFPTSAPSWRQQRLMLNMT